MRKRSNRIKVKGPGKQVRPHCQIQITKASKGVNRKSICSTDFLITSDKLKKMFIKTLTFKENIS